MGDNTVAALPVSRGFDSSLGFWSGGQDYLTHWDVNSGGYDMMENTTIRGDLNNTWTTEIFAKHAVDTISRFSPESDARLFLYLAFQNVHWPLMAPQAYVDRFAHTTGNNTARQLVCAMAAFLDDGVANVTAALKRAGIFEDTLIIFTSDNVSFDANHPCALKTPPRINKPLTRTFHPLNPTKTGGAYAF